MKHCQKPQWGVKSSIEIVPCRGGCCLQIIHIWNQWKPKHVLEPFHGRADHQWLYHVSMHVVVVPYVSPDRGGLALSYRLSVWPPVVIGRYHLSTSKRVAEHQPDVWVVKPFWSVLWRLWGFSHSSQHIDKNIRCHLRSNWPNLMQSNLLARQGINLPEVWNIL